MPGTRGMETHPKPVCRRRHRASDQPEPAYVDRRVYVDAIGSFEAFEHAVADHGDRAAGRAFFIGLKKDPDRAVEFLAEFVEQERHPDADGGVDVVAAEVRRSRMLRRVRHLLGVLDRQGIHVGAVAHHRPWMRAFDINEQPRFGNRPFDL